MKSHFNVYPRFTAGSPASVPREQAWRVVEEEKLASEYAPTPISFSGIAEEVWEVRGKLHYRDLMTGETGIKEHRTRGH